MASLLSDLCELIATRASMALDTRASEPALERDEALALSRLLQLTSMLLAEPRLPTPTAEATSLEELLVDAERDAALVARARDQRRAWTAPAP